jgi:hypothetical protein
MREEPAVLKKTLHSNVYILTSLPQDPHLDEGGVLAVLLQYRVVSYCELLHQNKSIDSLKLIISSPIKR